MFSQLYDHKQLFAIHNTEICFKIVKGTCFNVDFVILQLCLC